MATKLEVGISRTTKLLYPYGRWTYCAKKGIKTRNIFLDEIGRSPVEFQTILLRGVEVKTLTRIGGGEVIHVDTRVVTATNHVIFL